MGVTVPGLHNESMPAPGHFGPRGLVPTGIAAGSWREWPANDGQPYEIVRLDLDIALELDIPVAAVEK